MHASLLLVPMAICGALSGLTPITLPVPAKAHLWRLRTTVSDLTVARKLCAALVLRQQVCVAAKD